MEVNLVKSPIRIETLFVKPVYLFEFRSNSRIRIWSGPFVPLLYITNRPLPHGGFVH